ncbi:hypothetical protein GCM10009527_055570 [Actinomadura nitritigenes]
MWTRLGGAGRTPSRPSEKKCQATALWECREEAGDQGDVSKVDEEPPDVIFGVAFLAVESGHL